MSAQLDLKEIERKAFRSTYSDGLWDMYMGLIVAGAALFIYRPPSGYSPNNIFLMLLVFLVSYALFWAGKKFLTAPRLGQVRFGEVRKRKWKTLAIVLGIFILLQAGLVVLTSTGWLQAGIGKWVAGRLDSGLLAVALIGSMMVGTSFIVIAYFTDFLRGYYIAILFSLAVFLMIYLNQPLYSVIIGALIFLPGLVLLVRFLKSHPLQPREGAHE